MGDIRPCEEAQRVMAVDIAKKVRAEIDSETLAISHGFEPSFVDGDTTRKVGMVKTQTPVPARLPEDGQAPVFVIELESPLGAVHGACATLGLKTVATVFFNEFNLEGTVLHRLYPDAYKLGSFLSMEAEKVARFIEHRMEWVIANGVDRKPHVIISASPEVDDEDVFNGSTHVSKLAEWMALLREDLTQGGFTVWPMLWLKEEVSDLGVAAIGKKFDLKGARASVDCDPGRLDQAFIDAKCVFFSEFDWQDLNTEGMYAETVNDRISLKVKCELPATSSIADRHWVTHEDVRGGTAAIACAHPLLAHVRRDYTPIRPPGMPAFMPEVRPPAGAPAAVELDSKEAVRAFMDGNAYVEEAYSGHNLVYLKGAPTAVWRTPTAGMKEILMGTPPNSTAQALSIPTSLASLGEASDAEWTVSNKWELNSRDRCTLLSRSIHLGLVRGIVSVVTDASGCCEP